MEFFQPLIEQREPQTDFPAYLDIDIQKFRKYKNRWLKGWRTSGHIDSNGLFVAPISFIDATQKIDQDELDMYFLLDNLLAIKQRQMSKST